MEAIKTSASGVKFNNLPVLEIRFSLSVNSNLIVISMLRRIMRFSEGKMTLHTDCHPGFCVSSYKKTQSIAVCSKRHVSVMSTASVLLIKNENKRRKRKLSNCTVSVSQDCNSLITF